MSRCDLSDERFRRDLHAGFGVPSDVVAAVVGRATGSSAATLSRIVRGYDNEVYRAATEDGVQVIVRIKRFGEDCSFAGESWAMERARLAGVPVPEVLLVDRLSDGIRQLPVMVQSVAPGRSLAERADLTPAQRRRTMAHAGEVLAQLNDVEVPGFWRPGPDGSWPNPEWETVMTSWVDHREAERDVICRMGFDSAQFSRMIALVRAYVHDFPCRQPMLCHGDFIPEHIFVDDDLRVCSVIDFGMYCGGPPIGDLAYLRFALTDPDFAAILTGYRADLTSREEFWRRLDSHALGLAIGHLASEITAGDSTAARVSAASLGRILRRFTA